jgi:hypothetical protein
MLMIITEYGSLHEHHGYIVEAISRIHNCCLISAVPLRPLDK